MAKRSILSIWAVFFLLFFQTYNASAQQDNERVVIKQDSDYFGFDLLTQKDVTLKQCTSACLRNHACVAFTYNVSAKFCFLKSDFGELKSFAGAIAGRVVSSGGDTDIGAPPKLSFVPEYLRSDAKTFRTGIENNNSKIDSPGFWALTNLARQNRNDGKAAAAIENLKAALSLDANDTATWLDLTNAANSFRSNNSSNNYKMRNVATAAAINSYLTSRTKYSRAAALAGVARALSAQQQYRPALTAYTKSLELDDVSFERSAYEALRREHGFKIVNHTIDSENLSPRACVQFSEKLPKPSSQYEKFLTVDHKPPAGIDVSEKQICVEGLQHGKNYKIGIRKGLPSTVGEDLLDDTTLDIYVRDRQPTVRFTGANFVLPLNGRQGIPLVAINTDRTKLELFRIGERALAPLLRESQFLREIGSYQIDDLVENLGQTVWDGSIAIKPDLNKEVVTSIPIDEALPDRQPGIYLLSAKPSIDNKDNYTRATQWFVISDIGLTTFAGDGKMRVFTRSLSTAKPLANIEVSLIARNNELLATGKTDAQGQASFDAGLTRGKGGLAPAMVTAKRNAGDFVFLDMSQPGFDFSDRGVTGRAASQDIDVYAWSERGIYRAGETVYVTALARDASASAIGNLPLTFVFTRPDGVEERRIVDNGEDLGGYSVQLPLTKNARHGVWQLQVYTDPKAEPVADQQFLVEDFLPDRTEFTLASAVDSIAIGQSADINVVGRYLYGAPAAGLALDAEMVVRTTRHRKGYEGYLFGLSESDEGSTKRFPIANIPPLDDKGETTFNVEVADRVATTRLQTAEIIAQMREGSGRAVERRIEIGLTPQNTLIGIRPQFDNAQIAEGADAGFEIIAVNAEGGKTALPGTKWSLVKIERHYQWYKGEYSWRYEAIDLETKIADGILEIDATAPATLSVPVEWGRYRLDVETGSATGPASSVTFNAGWFVHSQSTQTPDGLEIALDKSSYKAGETAKLKVSPRFAGEMLIAIGTNQIVATQSVTIPASGAVIDIPVADDWGAGAYVLATLYRPGDNGSSRMPGRAIGVKWLSVDPQDHELNVSLDIQEQNRPHEPLVIPVSVSGINPGTQAFVTVAAVDVGILNLTNYQSPDPVKQYFGQRKLGVVMRDIYGRLIDGSLGLTGKLRTGGDEANNLRSNESAPTQKLVAFYSGPVRLDDDGKAEISFDIPQFNGTIRVMATAWTSKGVGATQSDVIVRDPVVISASLPKFMSPDDASRLLVEIANTDAPAGTFAIDIQSSDNITLDTASIPAFVDLDKGTKTSFSIPINARTIGSGWAKINLSQPDGFLASHEIALNIRAGSLPVTSKINVSLAPESGSITIDENLLAGNQLEGANISVSVAHPSSIDVPSLLLQLNHYPYGCAEQITSKALPLLYANDFSAAIPGISNEEIKKRVQIAIDTVLSYQSGNGGFSLWGSWDDDLWLSAYVSDFLTRAAEKGYRVPTQSMKAALSNLQNVLAYQNNLEENDASIAYALYVLARNRMASAGDLRYYSDTQLQSFRTPIARAQLAAGMALYGDQQRAELVFNSAFELARQDAGFVGTRYSFGTPLRDAAAMLALASESRPEPSDTSGMRKLVASLANADQTTNTQEQAWLLLAARALKSSNEAISLDVDGLPHAGTFARQISGADIADEPLRIGNRTDQQLQATITTVAIPQHPLPAGGDGLSITRTYFRLDGTEANVSQVKQNERFVVVLEIEQLSDRPARLIVTDLLPAGFEIDNPRLIQSAELDNFNWLPDSRAVHSDFRDDRFVTAFNHSIGQKTNYSVAYTVRAVTPGTYMHPAATVEDMYRPQFSARTATGWMAVQNPQ